MRKMFKRAKRLDVYVRVNLLKYLQDEFAKQSEEATKRQKSTEELILHTIREIREMASKFQARLDQAQTQITEALQTAITKETEELKKAIADASNEEETNTAIDNFAANIVAGLTSTIDKLSDDATGTGTGGGTGDGGEGETPIP